MFYDILKMCRRTFDRLVNDLRPHIQGQITRWRQSIGVEKKVIVTLFKLMHGVSIPLVADKAALGKSTVGEILRQVCVAISTYFGHLIAWPVGCRLARVAAGFQSKQCLPNCISAIDGSHVYIAAPSNTIVAADHRNRYKPFSILLQGVWTTNVTSPLSTQAPQVHCTTMLTSRARSYSGRWKMALWADSTTMLRPGRLDCHSHLTLWRIVGSHS